MLTTKKLHTSAWAHLLGAGWRHRRHSWPPCCSPAAGSDCSDSPAKRFTPCAYPTGHTTTCMMFSYTHRYGSQSTQMKFTGVPFQNCVATSISRIFTYHYSLVCGPAKELKLWQTWQARGWLTSEKPSAAAVGDMGTLTPPLGGALGAALSLMSRIGIRCR